MKRLTATAAVAALTAGMVTGVALPVASAAEPADTVITNGKIYTVNTSSPWAQAVAISDGEIVYVGSSSGAKRYIGANTRVQDVQGRMVMPGLIDAHSHPASGGAGLTSCSLDYAQLTVQETLDVVQGCIDDGLGIVGTGNDRWLVVSYWDLQGLKPAGTKMSKVDLDRLDAGNIAVVLRSTDGHNNVVNSRALELAGVTKDTPDPAIGFMERDGQGNPTGYFSDAGSLVTQHVPAKSDEDRAADLLAGLRALNERGVTGIYGNTGSLKQYNMLQDAGDLDMRVSAAPSPTAAMMRDTDTQPLIDFLNAEKAQYDRGNVHVDTVGEILVDGVMEYPAFTASVLQPYLEQNEDGDWVPSAEWGTGPTYFTDAQLDRLVAALDREGWNSHFHAIGDRAVRQVLNAVEAAGEANDGTQTTFSTTHTELIDPADIPRFVDLGVIASFAPQWAQRDFYTVDNLAPYIGPERAARLYPFGQLDDVGATLTSGSDWPVDELSPWRMVEQAVTRSGAEGFDGKPGRLAGQAVSLERSIQMITRNAAEQIGLEDEIGSIEVGKRADLLVLDQNLFEVPVHRISKTEPLQVYFDGAVIDQREQANASVTATARAASYGQPVKVSVSVSGDDRVAEGTVTVKRGGKTLARDVALRNGVAAASVSGLSAGTHDLTVSYRGDFTYAPSSANVRVRVAKATPRVSLQLRKSTVTTRQQAELKLSVSVPGAKPARVKVQVVDGKKLIKTASVSAPGTVKIRLPKLTSGTHRIAVKLVATGNLTARTSSTATLRVVKR